MFTIKQFVFNPLEENTYVVYNETGECLVIDPGCYFGNERNELKEFIEAASLTPKYLLNTHCHLDHVFGNAFIHTTYGLLLHIHEKEKPVLDNAAGFGLMWGLPFTNYTGNLLFLREGDRVRLGKDEFKVLFTPGHSPGSISFYCEAQQVILSGDVLFRNSIGRSDLPGGSLDTLLHSIRTQLLVLPDEVVVYSGHGPETTLGEEKKNNPFLQ